MRDSTAFAEYLARGRAAQRRWLIALWRELRRGQTYLTLLYLLATFPLGMFYFIVLIVGLAISIGTSVIGAGLLLLLFILGFAQIMGAVERRLVMACLGVTIAPRSGPHVPYASRWQWVKARLTRPLIWRSVAYLCVEFPFGVLSFCLTFALLALSCALLLYPLAYIVDMIAHHSGAAGPYIFPDVWVGNTVDPLALVFCVLIFELGIVVARGSLFLLNGVAHAWGRFAQAMLGMSAAEVQLAEARASAARERSRAEQADQRRRELIVNVSHELRTPIANIRGHVESLRMAGSDLSAIEAQRYLAIVARETERLGGLVDDLLALARAEAGELRLEPRPLAVGAVVDDVYHSLVLLAQRDRQVTLVRTVAPDLPCALADRDRLAQVLLNLARNAITATPAGGLVFIDLERADATHLSLAVSDTGSGIAPQDLERIFDRFYRADISRTRATGGYGLGLSIVRDLVHAMGGSITVTSTVGMGSCFRVLLRVAGG